MNSGFRLVQSPNDVREAPFGSHFFVSCLSSLCSQFHSHRALLLWWHAIACSFRLQHSRLRVSQRAHFYSPRTSCIQVRKCLAKPSLVPCSVSCSCRQSPVQRDGLRTGSGCAQTLFCLTLQPPGLQPTQALCPWDYPGKNTGVGCHFLLQGLFLTQGSNSSLRSLGSPILSGGFFTTSPTQEAPDSGQIPNENLEPPYPKRGNGCQRDKNKYSLHDDFILSPQGVL